MCLVRQDARADSPDQNTVTLVHHAEAIARVPGAGTGHVLEAAPLVDGTVALIEQAFGN